MAQAMNRYVRRHPFLSQIVASFIGSVIGATVALILML